MAGMGEQPGEELRQAGERVDRADRRPAPAPFRPSPAPTKTLDELCAVFFSNYCQVEGETVDLIEAARHLEVNQSRVNDVARALVAVCAMTRAGTSQCTWRGWDHVPCTPDAFSTAAAQNPAAAPTLLFLEVLQRRSADGQALTVKQGVRELEGRGVGWEHDKIPRIKHDMGVLCRLGLIARSDIPRAALGQPSAYFWLGPGAAAERARAPPAVGPPAEGPAAQYVWGTMAIEAVVDGVAAHGTSDWALVKASQPLLRDSGLDRESLANKWRAVADAVLAAHAAGAPVALVPTRGAPDVVVEGVLFQRVLHLAARLRAANPAGPA